MRVIACIRGYHVYKEFWKPNIGETIYFEILKRKWYIVFASMDSELYSVKLFMAVAAYLPLDLCLHR